MRQPASSLAGDLWWFAGWAAIGGLYALALLALLSVGLLILVAAVIPTVVLGRMSNASVGRPGLIAGAALPLFYVAFVNRHGPGTICSATQCHDEWNPWPWVLTGIGVAAIGATIFAKTRRNH